MEREAPITRPPASSACDLEARVAVPAPGSPSRSPTCGASRRPSSAAAAGAGEHPPGGDLGGAVPARVDGRLAAAGRAAPARRVQRQADPRLERRAVGEVGPGQFAFEQQLARAGCTRRSTVPSPSRRTRCRWAAAACRPCSRSRSSSPWPYCADERRRVRLLVELQHEPARRRRSVRRRCRRR